MARAYHILWAAQHRRAGWDDLCRGYRRRIGKTIPVRDQPIRVRGRGGARRREEGKAMLAALPDPCWTVALDPRGRALDSVALARELRRLRETWPHPVAFLIGSDLGLAPEVVEAARMRLSLGPMTFGHELARLILYEQLYRVSAIERGIKYHRDPL